MLSAGMDVIYLVAVNRCTRSSIVPYVRGLEKQTCISITIRRTPGGWTAFVIIAAQLRNKDPQWRIPYLKSLRQQKKLDPTART